MTREEDKALRVFGGIEDTVIKTDLINWLFTGDGLLSKTFVTAESKLKAIQAILDGEWEVEEPLYYVKLVDSEFGYLNITPESDFTVTSKEEVLGHKTKFTRAEAIAIDPRYEQFLEEVR
ncbi:hypothetical protein Javan425_0040 [Streptococcus phage Javan425]|uniref:Phage protein n=1 Tax=Streptococcus porcinus str. Jelinkova 176 TaxID=873448 RepID=A0ABN0CWI2_STRPO|nr:hypothetical protein STRPO_0263 [Streptococcus porcinus str. Jelinkova 176]QBX18365.1 hypothetical protein Javan423_0019 [Streptococcus phage Javan423]QBX18445.1 hypothetical protein Javan425_0040 [Streptococcus phage Javan425]